MWFQTVVFALLYAIGVSSAYFHRVRMIQQVPRITLGKPSFLTGRLRTGDIVYMASRHTPLYQLSNHYAVLAAWWLRQPFYHVFVVLPGSRVGHFVAPNYIPRLSVYCGHFETGDLLDYVEKRQAFQPLYMVFRHKTLYEPDFTPYLQGLCHLRFASFPVITRTVLLEK